MGSSLFYSSAPILIFSVSIQLFELLGPEGLEMISTLLQKRTAVVSGLATIPPDRSSYPAGQSSSPLAVTCAKTVRCLSP